MADNVKSFRSSEPNRTSPERRSHFRVEAVVSVRTRRPRAAARGPADPRPRHAPPTHFFDSRPRLA